MPRGPISRQVDAVRKKTARPLIHEIQPSKKRKTNFRFGFVFSFKLSTILIIAFYLLAGAGLTFVISKSLRANSGDNISTVDFYANTANVTVNQGSGDGWSGIEKVLGEAQVRETDEQGFYTAENSAVYRGGKQALILDNFTTKEFIKTSYERAAKGTTTIQDISKEPENLIEENDNEEMDSAADISTTSENIVIPEAEIGSGSSTDFSIEPAEPVVVEPVVPEVISQSPDIEQPSLEIVEEIADDIAPVEVAEPGEAAEEQNHLPVSAPVSSESEESSLSSEIPSAVAPIETPASAGESLSPISLLGDLKKIAALSRDLLGKAAGAQSLFGSEADDRNILFGAFKSAKIKISLAAVRQAVENNQPAPAPEVQPASESDVPPAETEDSGAVEPAVENLDIQDVSDVSGTAEISAEEDIPAPAAENNSEDITLEMPAENILAPDEEQAASVMEIPVEEPAIRTVEDSVENILALEPVSAPENKTQSAASVIIEKVLDFFTPNEAGAEEIVQENKNKIIIWYSFANEGAGDYWRELGVIDAEELANRSLGNYLVFDAPFLNDWRDLDDLRIKFEGVAESGNFTVYLDGVLAEISYDNGKNKPEEKKPETNKDILQVDGQEINFVHTDNNDNENLIIKTNAKKYFGLTNATVYFSVENIGVRAEQVNFQYYFPEGAGEVSKMEKLDQESPYLLETPKIEAQIYECANGWDKRENFWTCYPSGEEKVCNLVSPNRRYCRVEGVEMGSEKKIKYRSRWENIGLNEKLLLPEKSFFKRLLGLGPQSKSVPETLQPVKATTDSVAIAPGEVKYYKATISFPPNSEGEFYIEAVGDGDGYGLLDPWWNSGWNFRLPILVDNSASGNALTEQQLYLEISSSTSRDFWRNIRSDGGDIRFTNSTETVELPYWIQSFDYAASSTKIWVQVDSIPSATTSKIFLYYGKSTATTTSNQYAPFTYSNLENIFYITSSSTGSNLKVISLIDNNQIQLDNQTAVNLNRQDIATLTGFASTSVIKSKGPIMAKISGGAALESAVPISFAGTSFVIPSGRNAETFYAYAPFADATTTIYDGLTQKQSNLILQGADKAMAQDIATGSLAIVEATEPILLSFVNSLPGDSLPGYPATTEDLYGVKSQFNLIGAVAASTFSIICSNHSSTTVSIARGVLQPNQICPGEAQGAGSAVRLKGANGAINAIQQNDGDGNESAMFWPFKEFSTEYMLPTGAAHIAVVCAPQSGLVELSVYNSSDVFVASTTCEGSGFYPGKAYFGAADATTYSAGARIVATNNRPFYAYYEDTAANGAVGGDETNLIGAVQARKEPYPALSFTFGAQEIKGPPTGTINSAAEKNDNSGRVDISIAVNDVSNDNSRARIDYVEQIGGYCDFSSPLAPTLDENPASISASFGMPVIQNKNVYQIGTTTGWINTDSGTNIVNFIWNSKTDLPDASGVYCLRLTANDNLSDQLISATTTIAIDNLAPTVPGFLTLAAHTGATVTLQFGTTSVDSNFKQYKIYYKPYDGTPVTEAGTLFGSSSDANLGAADFNNAATTTISGLTAGLKYTFNIFAYDSFGNKASSTIGVDATANDAPTGIFNSAMEKTDGSARVDISITVDDANDDNTLRAKIEYEAGSLCAFSAPLDPTIDTGNISATFPPVDVDDNDAYQVGTTSNYILTSLGANTVSFDWLSGIDLATATGTFCLRLTVNDGVDDQTVADKIVVVIDNVKPLVSGNLVKGETAQNYLQLILPTGRIAADDNEPFSDAYKIFYKAGTSGVKQSDTPLVNSALSAYSFNGSSSVIVGSLTPGTDYVFNIWAYDSFGNTASATEITIKTDSDLTNKSLTFTNPQSGSSTLLNLAVADNATPWNFRAVVSDVGGYALIDDITLRLADLADNAAPFDDLSFRWTQSGDSFAEIGADVNSAASLDASSASNCSGDSCTIDFNIIFAKTFATTSADYSAELYSTDSAARTAEDSFLNIFQVRKNWLDQVHYRWRNDDGGG